MTVSSRASTTTPTAARTRLGLTAWQLRLAVEVGLLDARKSGRIELASIAAAEVDPTFNPRLVAEERLVARQAAKLVGVPLDRFREAARAGVVTPVRIES